MHIDYDIKNGYELQSCPVCKYVCHEYYDYEKQCKNPEKPFIKLEGPVNYIVPETRGSKLKILYQYICPQCGVVQIDPNLL